MANCIRDVVVEKFKEDKQGDELVVMLLQHELETEKSTIHVRADANRSSLEHKRLIGCMDKSVGMLISFVHGLHEIGKSKLLPPTAGNESPPV